MMQTPRSLGYYFPAEWERHESTWLTFPKNTDSWPDNLPEAQASFLRFAEQICINEKVHIIADDQNTQNSIIKMMEQNKYKISNIEFHHCVSDDCWTRDHGPSFLINQNGEQALVAWKFNGWGEKYPSQNDRNIARFIADCTGLNAFYPEIVLEGGSIETNGAKTILTSKTCLLNKNRNPQLTQNDIEQYIYDYYCADQILWLPEGLTGDDTDGHIDNLARFADEQTLLLCVEKDKHGINYQALQKNLKDAKKFRLANGKQITIVELFLPDALYLNNITLPASYANFYICNSGVILPIYRCKQDQMAYNTLEQVFPNKKIIPVDASIIIHGLGSWHCLSQQEPSKQI